LEVIAHESRQCEAKKSNARHAKHARQDDPAGVCFFSTLASACFSIQECSALDDVICTFGTRLLKAHAHKLSAVLYPCFFPGTLAATISFHTIQAHEDESSLYVSLCTEPSGISGEVLTGILSEFTVTIP
jgi:hypothetical protein